MGGLYPQIPNLVMHGGPLLVPCQLIGLQYWGDGN